MKIRYNHYGKSSIAWFEIGTDFIRVKFYNKIKIYQYSYNGRAGKKHVDELKRLAMKGKGLNSYIQLNVKYKYD